LENRNLSHHSEIGIKVRNRLERCGGRWGVRDGFATGVLPSSHVAITCHLLAALHFRTRHLRARQTRERGRANPQGNQSQDDEVVELRHSLIVPPPGCRVKDYPVASWGLQMRLPTTQIEVDSRCNDQRQRHRDQDSADHCDGQRLQHLRAGAEREG
jgi:hypothetical protein